MNEIVIHYSDFFRAGTYSEEGGVKNILFNAPNLDIAKLLIENTLVKSIIPFSPKDNTEYLKILSSPYFTHLMLFKPDENAKNGIFLAYSSGNIGNDSDPTYEKVKEYLIEQTGILFYRKGHAWPTEDVNIIPAIVYETFFEAPFLGGKNILINAPDIKTARTHLHNQRGIKVEPTKFLLEESLDKISADYFCSFAVIHGAVSNEIQELTAGDGCDRFPKVLIERLQSRAREKIAQAKGLSPTTTPNLGNG